MKSNFRFIVETNEKGEVVKLEHSPADGFNIGVNVFIPLFRFAKENNPELMASILSSIKYVNSEEK